MNKAVSSSELLGMGTFGPQRLSEELFDDLPLVLVHSDIVANDSAPKPGY